jgi:hypothetical protein
LNPDVYEKFKSQELCTVQMVAAIISPIHFLIFFHIMLKLILIPKYIAEKIPIYIAEQSNKDVGNFIPEFSVTGLLWSAASSICDGNFR